MPNLNFAVTTRAIIIDQDQLLMVKHQPEDTYHALPGGRLEIGETLEDGLARELMEETGITPMLGRLLFINQFINPTHHRVEFFFWVKNAADYRQANPAEASHGHEIASHLFANAADSTLNLLPNFLQHEYSRLIELKENYPLKLIRSY